MNMLVLKNDNDSTWDVATREHRTELKILATFYTRDKAREYIKLREQCEILEHWLAVAYRDITKADDRRITLMGKVGQAELAVDRHLMAYATTFKK
jgi:hypothetical protein